jgi:hypothetical protein
MNYQQAKIFFTSVIIILILAVVGIVMHLTHSDKSSSADTENISPIAQTEVTAENAAEPVGSVAPVESQPSTSVKFSHRVGNLAKQFADSNYVHLQAAEVIGIQPIEQVRDIWRIRRPLLHIASCEDFALDTLTHSFPYLVPEAATLLHDIGSQFHQRLSERNGADYRVIVTSLLRTAETVSRLRRRNGNSTENSAHLYGTTFDITYVRFEPAADNKVFCTDGDLKNLLAEVLLDLRENGRCLVKYEVHQGCFHVTATGKLPSENNPRKIVHN